LLAQGQRYAFGVLALGGAVLHSESWRHRVMHADQRGTRPLLAELPGYPSRMCAAADGGFWLTCFVCRTQLVEFVLRGSRLRDSLEMVPQIVIAALNGKARGNGGELALACDMRYVSEHATLSFPEADMGGIPGGGGPARLPAVVGRARAIELLCSGREVGAREMVDIGFALAAFAHERLMDEVTKIARNMAEKGPIALRGIKRIAHTRLAPGLREARWVSDELRSKLEWSHDVNEAIAAHKEGRKPRFTGK